METVCRTDVPSEHVKIVLKAVVVYRPPNLNVGDTPHYVKFQPSRDVEH